MQNETLSRSSSGVTRLLGALLTIILLFAAFVSIAYSGSLNRYLTGFHGYSQQVELSLPAVTGSSPVISLILPAFNSCVDSCPANLMLSKAILDQTDEDLSLIILSVQPADDNSALLNRYVEVTGQQAALLDQKASSSWDFLARHEQIRQPREQEPQHAGHIYLYHHSSQTLLTYPVPDTETIISDIHRLKTGAKHG